MYLRIVLRYLDWQRARENRELHFQDNLSSATTKDAEAIMNKLPYQVTYKDEIRHRNIFDNKVKIGLLVTIVVRS